MVFSINSAIFFPLLLMGKKNRHGRDYRRKQQHGTNPTGFLGE